MSYILTALKKAQQERDRGRVPRLSCAPEPPPTSRRRPLFLWVGGALALSGAAVLATLLSWLGENLDLGELAVREVTAGAARAPVEPQAAPGERVGVATPQSLSPSSSQKPSAADRLFSTTPQVKAPQVTTPQVVAPQRDLQPVADAAAPSAVSTVSPAPMSETDRQKAAPIPPAAPRAESESLPAPAVQTETEEPDPVPAPTVTSALARASPQSAAASPNLAPSTEVLPTVVVAPEESTLEPDPDAYASLPLLRELSYSIQTVLPDLRILVHVYAKSPTDRFVIIQQTQYREGDQLGKDLTLEAITLSGAVLRYQDTAFRINR